MFNVKKWLVTISLVALGAVPALAQNPPYWHDVRSIARTVANSDFVPSLGKAAGTPFDSIFVLYAASSNFETYQCFQLKRSRNTGVTFSESLLVMRSDLWSQAYRCNAIAHDAHGIHVAVSDFKSGSYQGAYYIRSTDGGNNWTTPYLLDQYGFYPALTVDDYGLNIFWMSSNQIKNCRYD